MATFTMKPGYAFEALVDIGAEQPAAFPCANPQNAVDSSSDTYAGATAFDLGGNLSGIVFSYSPEQLIEMGKWQPTGVQISLDCEVSFDYGDAGYAILMPCSRDSETGVCSIPNVETQMIALFPEAVELGEGESVTVSKRGQSILTAQINNEIIQAGFQGYTSMIFAFAAASVKIYDASITVTGNKKISKVIFGNDTVIDLTADTVAADKLLSGYTAHDASGAVITGTAEPGDDTSDADALASDIRIGKTAYVNGTKLTGTNTNNCDTTGDSVTPNMMILGVTAHDATGQRITGSIAPQPGLTLYISHKDVPAQIPAGFYHSSGTVGISQAEYSKLTSENIRSGVSILGVMGSYTGSGGGGSISHGIIYDAIDSSGYPLTATLVGQSKVLAYQFYNTSASGTYKQMTSITLPSNLTEIGPYSFYYANKLALTQLPDSVTIISTYAFYACSSLALTKLPPGMTNITASSFYNCSSLALTYLPSSITTIGSSAFYGCSKLKLTTVAASTSIGGNAFQGCSGLGPKLKIKSPKIGTATASNSTCSFKNCTGLKAVWISSEADYIYAISATYSPFNGCTNLMNIYTNASEKKSNWGAFWNYTSASNQATVHYNTSESEFDALQIA